MVSFSPDDQSFPSLQAPKGYGARLDALRSAAADCGRDPSGVVASGWFFVLTAPTRSTVDDLLHTPIARAMALGVPAHRWAPFGAEHPLGADFAGGHDLLPQTLDDAALEHALAAVPEGLLRSAVFAGTPSELAERFIEYRDQGLAHPVLLNGSLLSQLGGGLLSVPAFLRLVKLLRKM
jgi:phthiodiolone/phenolphthiodiolone dimycocerosates ketoreductase